MLKYKKWLTALVLISALLWAFHGQFINFALRKGIERSVANLGMQLHYQKSDEIYGKIEFKDMTVEAPEGSLLASAPSLTINYAVHPLSFTLQVDVDWKDPVITLQLEKNPIKNILNSSQNSSPWFHIEGHVLIENGTFNLESLTGIKSYSGTISHALQEENEADYNLMSLDGKSTLSFNLKGSDFAFKAHEADAALASDLILPLYPELEHIQILSGTINGELSGSIADPSKNNLIGDLTIADLSLKDPSRNAKVQCESITLNGTNDKHLAEIAFSKGSILLEESSGGGHLQSLNGRISLSKSLEIDGGMNGFLSSQGEQSYLRITASGDIPELKKSSLNISLKHIGNKRDTSTVHLEASDLMSDQSKISLDLQNVRDREFLFTQHLIEKTFPEVNPIQFTSGIVSGKISLRVQDGFLKEVQASSLDVKNLHVQLKPWELAAGAKEIKGTVGVVFDHLGEESSLEADLFITKGETKFTGIQSDIWHFTDIETRLVVKNGVVQKSSGSVKLGGLKGRAEILEGQQSEFMRFDFDGTGADLQPFLPLHLQNGLETALLEDRVKLTAGVSLIPDGAKVLGELNIASTKGADSSPIRFGFNLEKVKPFLKDTPEALESKEQFFKKTSAPLLDKFTPAFLFPHALALHTHLIKEVGYSSFTLRDGFFSTDHLLLEKFVSPFIFPENEMRLTGRADIYATFDLTGISLYYHADDVVLQNDALIIAVDHIGKAKGTLPAFNRFDFLSNRLFGSLPLKEASYFDKDSGLLFTDVNSMVYFEGQKVHVDKLEGFSSGLRFAGEVDVDYSLPGKGYFDVDVRVREVEGLFSQLQDFYSHFDKNAPITAIPLESRVSLGQNPGLLLFNVRPDDFDFQLIMDLSLFDGSMSFPNLELSLKDLSVNFHYNHQEKLLDLEAIQGMFLQGKPEKELEFSFHAEPMRFDNFPKSSLPFHIQIKDDNTPFVEFKGQLDATDQNTFIAFEDGATHIGGLQPQKMELSLKDFSRVDHFHAKIPVRLSALLYDLQRFNQTGLFFITKEWIKDLNDLSAVSGEFTVDLAFSGDTGKLQMDAVGHDVDFDEQHFKNVHLNGSMRDGHYVIDELALDYISIACEAHQLENSWKVDFLGVKLGEGFVVGLDGAYNPNDPLISAHVNLMEIDLNKMTDWMALYPFLESFQPKGLIKGVGEITFENSENKGWLVDANLDTSFKGLGWKDLSLKDGEHVSCHFRSDKGLTLHNLKSSLKKDIASSEEVEFELKKLDYEFASQSLSLENLKFKAAPSHLPLLAQQMKNDLPNSSSAEMQELISELKKDEPLEGQINASFRPGAKSLELKLKDGVYNIWDDARTLSQFTLNLEDEEIKVSTQYLLNEEFVWIAFRINPDYLESGEIVLADTFSIDEEEIPLQITWKLDPDAGLVIEKAVGRLSGLKFNLAENTLLPSTKDAFRLIGSIEIDGSRAKNILPKMQKEAIETLLLGKGYTIEGQFDIAKEVEKQGDRDVRFFGVLKGTDVELKGYRFQTASAQILLEPNMFQMMDLALRDPAGSLLINNITGKKDAANRWNLSIPLATAYDFRPSLLKEVGKPDPQSRKPLIVRHLFVQDITGQLADASSFTGYGNLYFENPQKKNIQNTLFAIPAEILTRIGLNLSVLTPVTGTVHYELQDGRIFLTKFKDVYSDRKISKFYLATSGAPSTIDLDGNLDIQVRFKQSTLLLKLVEMFMINVQGTLQKPAYSLQRQKYLMKENLYHSTNEQEQHAR